MLRILDAAFVVYPSSSEVRSRAFFEGVLGLSASMEHHDGEQFWVEYEVGSLTLGIGNEPFLKPCGDGPHLAIEVDNFETAIAHLRNCGAVFALEPFDGPACRAAIILDPDGNRIGIHKRNRNS